MYTFLDGWGVRQSGTAIGYTSWLLFFNGWGILAYTQSRRGWMAVREHARLRWRISLLGASLSVGSYSIVLWAMSQASIPAVAALREVSVVIAAVMGTVWLRESMGLNRILGACMVCAGVMLIRLAGNA
jgi:drug/metabolite transporter (DMT)-like permease